MTRIYVGNLHPATTVEHLQPLFAKFGTVNKVGILQDEETGKSRGFGFVLMGKDQEGQDAIHGLNGTSVNGRALAVLEAMPPARTTAVKGMLRNL
jgi:RNA recognition motif-containing protein